MSIDIVLTQASMLRAWAASMLDDGVATCRLESHIRSLSQ